MATDDQFAVPVAPNSDASALRLSLLVQELGRYDEGKETLQYLKDNNITVRFLNPYSAEEWGIIQKDNAKYDPATKTVLLNPNAPDDRLLSDIPHEAWHATQDKQGILNAMHQVESPTQKVALHFMVEAAAYTQQAIDGVPLPKDEMKVTQDGKTIEDLRLVYENALKDNKTPEAARLDVFKAALKYESKFDSSLYVDVSKMGWNMEDAKAPDATGGAAHTRMALASPNAELSNEKFSEIMRRAGNMTFSGDGGNFLSSMSDADLQQLATSQMTPRTKEALTETQAAYDEVRRQVAPKTR